ncbi:MAG: hypothetical protein ACFCBV_06075 [Phycisphaerales bacterium]
MEEPSNPPEVPKLAPPVMPAGEIGAGVSRWPGVIGVLICIFAGLEILQRVFGTIAAATIHLLPLPPEAQLPPGLWLFTLIVSIVGLPISFIHLLAGIQTIRRRSRARLWVSIFFVYVLVMLVPSVVLQYLTMQHQAAVATQQGSAPPGYAALMQAIGPVVLLLTIAFSMAWPMFLLIWYSRRSIREEVSAWSAA